MIDSLTGKIKNINERTISLVVSGVGFLLNVPKGSDFTKDTVIEFFTYLHWNQDNGPSIYGFKTEFERQVFLLIIECPKIGPSIALNILSQIPAANFLKIVSSQDEKALSAVNGIGNKKAEQLIVSLKHKVSKIISSCQSDQENQQIFAQWQNINDVLTTLGYSKTEITRTLQYLSQKYATENISLDQLIRAALTFVSNKV